MNVFKDTAFLTYFIPLVIGLIGIPLLGILEIISKRAFIWGTGIILCLTILFLTFYVDRYWVEKARPRATELPKPEPFRSDVFGILVTNFYGVDDLGIKGRQIQSSIVATLNSRFKKLKISDAEAKEYVLSDGKSIKSFNEARNLGKEYNAQIVMFGAVTIKGYIPQIAVVNPQSELLQVIEAETYILKDENTFTMLEKLNDIRLPALTEKPLQLASFITGLKYLDNKDFPNSLKYFKEALSDVSNDGINNAPIYFYIGVSYQGLGDNGLAYKNYKQSEKLGPRNPQTLTNIGVYFHKKNDYKEALAYYNKAISNESLSITHYNRGVLYETIERFDEALKDMDEALKLNPNVSLAYYTRGVILGRNKKEYDFAINDFTMTLEFRPLFGPALYNRGVAYYMKGPIEDALAEKDFLKCLEIYPKRLESLYFLGLIYERRESKDFPKAVNYLSKYVDEVKPPNNLTEDALVKINKMLKKDKTLARYLVNPPNNFLSLPAKNSLNH